MWDRGFTTTALNDYQSQVRERANQFVEKMLDLSQRKESIDLRAWFQYFAWDVMFDLAFGGRGPQFMQDGEDSQGYIAPMQDVVQASSALGHVPALTKIVKLFPSKDVHRYVKMVRNLFRDRIGDPAPVPDIFRFLVSRFRLSHRMRTKGLFQIADLSPSRSTPHDQQILREAQADASLLIIAGESDVEPSNSLYNFVLDRFGHDEHCTSQPLLPPPYGTWSEIV